MRPLLNIFSLVTIGMLSLQGCATQSDLYSLENFLTARIRDQESLMDKKLSEKTSEGRQLRDQSASLGADLERIREDIQSLSGRLDEKEHQSTSKLQAIDASVKALTARLDRIEGITPQGNTSLSPTPALPAPDSVGTPPMPLLTDKSEAELYEEGKKSV